MPKYGFSENNSGGSFRLRKKDYEAMFRAGWVAPALELDIDRRPFSGNRDDVPYGWRHGVVGVFPTIRDAVESFEAATGRDFFEEGCNCCGAPFSISCDEDGRYEYISGDSVERRTVRPW